MREEKRREEMTRLDLEIPIEALIPCLFKGIRVFRADKKYWMNANCLPIFYNDSLKERAYFCRPDQVGLLIASEQDQINFIKIERDKKCQ